MREFMTKVSDYFNEWREDPEREDGQLTRVFIIAAAIVAAVLIALLLWWGYGVQEKRREEAAAKARELQETQKMQDAQAAFALQEAQGACNIHFRRKSAGIYVPGFRGRTAAGISYEYKFTVGKSEGTAGGVGTGTKGSGRNCQRIPGRRLGDL